MRKILILIAITGLVSVGDGAKAGENGSFVCSPSSFDEKCEWVPNTPPLLKVGECSTSLIVPMALLTTNSVAGIDMDFSTSKEGEVIDSFAFMLDKEFVVKDKSLCRTR